MHLGTEGPLCDRCFDDRIVVGIGLPRLPDAPLRWRSPMPTVLPTP
jgi:hypothetical protein